MLPLHVAAPILAKNIRSLHDASSHTSTSSPLTKRKPRTKAAASRNIPSQWLLRVGSSSSGSDEPHMQQILHVLVTASIASARSRSFCARISSMFWRTFLPRICAWILVAAWWSAAEDDICAGSPPPEVGTDGAAPSARGASGRAPAATVVSSPPDAGVTRSPLGLGPPQQQQQRRHSARHISLMVGRDSTARE